MPLRFFVDAMLGNIARKLRQFGHDSAYDSHIIPTELIRAAAAESRIIITRNKGIALQCDMSRQDCILVSSNSTREQMLEILERLSPGRLEISSDTKMYRLQLCHCSGNRAGHRGGSSRRGFGDEQEILALHGVRPCILGGNTYERTKSICRWDK